MIRCILKSGHLGRHLFAETISRSILGDCGAKRRCERCTAQASETLTTRNFGEEYLCKDCADAVRSEDSRNAGLSDIG